MIRALVMRFLDFYMKIWILFAFWVIFRVFAHKMRMKEEKVGTERTFGAFPETDFVISWV